MSSARAARRAPPIARSPRSDIVDVTREPKATVARIAIFAAASAPDVGRIGLGVAEPLRLGERLLVRLAASMRGG